VNSYDIETADHQDCSDGSRPLPCRGIDLFPLQQELAPRRWLVDHIGSDRLFHTFAQIGVYDKSPYFRRLSLVSSSKPLRDLSMAIVCFVATMAVTIAITIALKDQVLPDNNLTAGFLALMTGAGILGVLFYMSRVIGRIFYGPPPATETGPIGDGCLVGLAGVPSQRCTQGCTQAEISTRVSIGRGDKIRTCDPLHPMQVRYQAAPRPDRMRMIAQTG
jgi:hypothetical protein